MQQYAQVSEELELIRYGYSCYEDYIISLGSHQNGLKRLNGSFAPFDLQTLKIHTSHSEISI